MSELQDCINTLGRRVAAIEWNIKGEHDNDLSNGHFEKVVKDAEKIYAQVSTLKSRYIAKRKKKFLEQAKSILEEQGSWQKRIILGSSVVEYFSKEELPPGYEVVTLNPSLFNLNLDGSLHWVTPECKTVLVWIRK